MTIVNTKIYVIGDKIIMFYKDLAIEDLQLQSIIEIGLELSRELDSITNLLKDNLDELDLFLTNNSYRGKALDSRIADYLFKKLEFSERFIDLFESELEQVTNYDRSNGFLDINDDFIDQDIFNKDINFFSRIKIEEFIENIEDVRSIIDDITNSLFMQKSNNSLASRLIM